MKIKTLKTAQSEIHQLSFYLKLYTALLFLGLAVTPLDSPAASQLAAQWRSSDHQLELSLTGTTGKWYRIEVSTDLQHWQALTNLWQTNPVTTWVDADSTNAPTRFYRSLQLSALDLYVAAPDTNYTWTLARTIPGTGQTTYVLDLTSQSWLTPAEVNRTIWKHWLIVVKPDNTTNSHALLFISGGSNPGSLPSSADANLRQIALDTGTVVAELKMVPNQPLTFAPETKGRTEDSLIAFNWDKFMRTGDERWPTRLPMTKAAVRAMDTITAFCATAPGGGWTVDKFVVAGASKRGWTTWTTAAVDPRVVGIVPTVIDVLNVEVSMAHHYSAHGFWSPAIDDYVEMDIPSRFGTPEFHALMEISDPYSYIGRYTMPKFIVNSSGDQFFLPDSSQFYFDTLPGVKYLRYIPNSSHSMSGTDYPTSLRAYYESVIFQTPLPQFSWTLQSSNTVRIVATDPPTEVKLWQASNANARDFRLGTIGPAWQSTNLSDQGGGVYLGAVTTPTQGWRASFVELTYTRSGNLAPLKFTTQVYVVPDILPFQYPP
ncbi:MAG: PhoPQ-activated pathogenicity-related protein [Verrucomicrobia bacterium ADurb.Bin118]|nr:MAG: PhoPQ-activated pathogenicity-related protein [Verrucomicrobia bacterium ADurb.Bin118]